MLKAIRKLFMKILTREAISYIFVGILTTIIGLVIYQIFLNLNFSIVLANTASTLVAILFAYIANKIWVFRSLQFNPKILFKEFFKFLSSRFITYVIDTILLVVLVNMLSYDPLISKISTSVVIIFLNYVASKKIVFKKK